MTTPVYLVTGAEFLADEALQRIRAEAGAEALSEVSFDSDAEVVEVINALGTSSLLGGCRIVIVRDAHELKKDQAEALARYLESPSPDALLVLIASGKSKLDAVVKKVGTVLSLEAPKGRRLLAWVRQRAQGHGLRLDDRAGWTLIDNVGVELRDLEGALVQLATGMGEGSRVGAADVKRAFPRLSDERIYAFTDAVGDRRLPVAMGTLRRLLDQGEEPLVLFGALVAHVRRMLRARSYAHQGARAVGNALGLPGWRAERLTKQARSYREEELTAALSLLASTDVAIKGGDAPVEASLERAVVTIVGS
ncbi:MAG: DNA polymerase III subunit delta [Actinomycetota bacterium]